MGRPKASWSSKKKPSEGCKEKPSMHRWLIHRLDQGMEGARWLKKGKSSGDFEISWRHGHSSRYKLNPIFNEYMIYKDQFDNKQRVQKSDKVKKGIFRSALQSYLGNEKQLIQRLSSKTTGPNAAKVYRIFGLNHITTPYKPVAKKRVDVDALNIVQLDHGYCSKTVDETTTEPHSHTHRKGGISSVKTPTDYHWVDPKDHLNIKDKITLYIPKKNRKDSNDEPKAAEYKLQDECEEYHLLSPTPANEEDQLLGLATIYSDDSRDLIRSGAFIFVESNAKDGDQDQLLSPLQRDDMLAQIGADDWMDIDGLSESNPTVSDDFHDSVDANLPIEMENMYMSFDNSETESTTTGLSSEQTTTVDLIGWIQDNKPDVFLCSAWTDSDCQQPRSQHV